MKLASHAAIVGALVDASVCYLVAAGLPVNARVFARHFCLDLFVPVLDA